MPKFILKYCQGLSYIYLVSVELSFCELRTKMVINVVDGKALGRIVDVIFSREHAKVVGVVVPGDKGFRLWGKKGDLFIPYDHIIRIGIDVVLVELRPLGAAYKGCNPDYGCPPNMNLIP